MPKNYNIEVVQKRLNKKTGEERKQLNITKKNGKMIKIKEVKSIYDHYVKKGIAAERIAIVGLNPERVFNLKGFKQDELYDFESDDYLEGKSSEVIDKLSKFESVQVIVY